MNGEDSGLPVEQFIQALTSQLDRAQDAMALKAHVRPLTFAVKDLTLDLRAHFAMSGSAVHIIPAGPGERRREPHTTHAQPCQPTLERVEGSRTADHCYERGRRTDCLFGSSLPAAQADCSVG